MIYKYNEFLNETYYHNFDFNSILNTIFNSEKIVNINARDPSFLINKFEIYFENIDIYFEKHVFTFNRTTKKDDYFVSIKIDGNTTDSINLEKYNFDNDVVLNLLNKHIIDILKLDKIGAYNILLILEYAITVHDLIDDINEFYNNKDNLYNLLSIFNKEYSDRFIRSEIYNKIFINKIEKELNSNNAVFILNEYRNIISDNLLNKYNKISKIFN